MQEYSSVSTVQYQRSTFKALYTAFVNIIILVFFSLTAVLALVVESAVLKKKRQSAMIFHESNGKIRYAV